MLRNHIFDRRDKVDGAIKIWFSMPLILRAANNELSASQFLSLTVNCDEPIDAEVPVSQVNHPMLSKINQQSQQASFIS